jgi:hypothetical protein
LLREAAVLISWEVGTVLLARAISASRVAGKDITKYEKILSSKGAGLTKLALL